MVDEFFLEAEERLEMILGRPLTYEEVFEYLVSGKMPSNEGEEKK